MLEKILAMIAALIVMYIAGLLVKRQNKCKDESKKLQEEVEAKTEDIIDEYVMLTGEEPDEYTLTHLEDAMNKFNKRLNEIETQRMSRLERREKQCKILRKHWK